MLALARGKDQRGWSLIEVVIVLAVVGLFLGAVVPELSQVIASGQVSRMVYDIQAISDALLAFHKDTGMFPEDKDEPNDLNGDARTPGGSGLLFNPGGLRGWNGPYLRKEIKENAFGGAITLERDLNLLDFTADGGNDVVVVFGNVPAHVAVMIDRLLDDGNTACTGFGAGRAFASGRICYEPSATTSPGLRVVMAPDRG